MNVSSIFPSILSANFLQLNSILTTCDRIGITSIHLDVMDAHFVPNLTFGPPIIRSVTQSFPQFYYDAHLMISHPVDYIKDFVDSGVHSLTVHYEANHPSGIIETVSKIKKSKVDVGLAFNPETQVDYSFLEKVIPHIDRILIMSVHPGFGGQKFIEKVLDKVDKIKEVRKKQGRDNKVSIQIDGGINEKTIEKSKKRGVDEFVIGSYLLKGDIQQQVKKIME